MPLTLEDMAWPEPCVVHVTKTLPRFSEVLALALGLVLLSADGSVLHLTRQKSEEDNGLAMYAWRLRRSIVHVMVTILAVCLLNCYTGSVFTKV